MVNRYKNLVPRHAAGAVVAPQASGWEKLWKIITGKAANEELEKAANPLSPPPMTPKAQDDISVVRKAAEEAGRRNEEAKSAQQPVKKYARGGVVGCRK